jgi:CubicO group peptidase (beta-lactamase class C family)
MDNFLFFFIPGCGLLFSVQGAWGLLSTFRTGSGVGPAGEPTSESSAAVKAKVRTRLRIKRISGIFWFCLGIATLWFSDIRDSWILPSVGLVWMIIGAWEFVSTFRRARQAAIAANICSELAAVSNAKAGRGLPRKQLASALILGVGIAMLCFSGIRIGASPAAVTEPTEEKSRLADIVTQHVERAFEQQGYIGLVVGAIAKDEEVLLGFGNRQLGDSHPPDAETVFEIGSISKAFTGILLAQKIENGELELDDHIAELLPEGWSLSESAREITLRHCTTHTTGFPRLPAILLSFAAVFRNLFGGDPYRDYSEEQFRDALAAVELEFEPGTERSYSNFAVGLLGFVLSTQNGSDYETLVTSKICQPLGMHRTVITNDKWHLDNMPAKYRAALKLGPATIALGSAEWQVPNHLAGAGAIRSTGRDMMTFLKANMGLIPTPFDAAIQRSHQELFQERADKAMGMNWIRSFESSISQNIIWHNGGTGGFRTYLGFTEDHQFGVVVMSTTADDVDALAEGILKALVREYAPGSRRPVTELYLEIRPTLVGGHTPR